MNKQSIGIIPARYASTRFPGKPLIDIAGKTMIQRVYERAAASNLDSVVVATDDERIYQAVVNFGGNVAMTGVHSNGTSRCIEAFLEQAIPYDILVNIQGDEPFIHPSQINAILKAFGSPSTKIATLVKKITNGDDLFNPNVVKVVLSQAVINEVYNALYFSRSPIPFVRDAVQEQWLEQHNFYKHIGLYAFSRSFAIEDYPTINTGILQDIEKLEQLQWLENNIAIRALETSLTTPNIDTPEDLKKALLWLEKNPV